MAGAQAAFDAITSGASGGVPAEAVAPKTPGTQSAAIKGYGEGSLGLAFIGGALGAAAGGVAWVALSTVTGWQLSLFAIVLGGLVGFGVGQGNGGRGGMGAGMIAALFALVGIVGTQAALTHFAIEDARRESSKITHADVMDHMAWGVYEEFESKGVQMTHNEDGWPPEVLAETALRWKELSPAEQNAYRASMRGDMDSAMEEAPLVSYAVAYLWASGWFGLLCVGLSVSTAWKIASRDVMEEAQSRGMIPNRMTEPTVVAPGSTTSGFRGLPPAAATAGGNGMKVESSVKPQASLAPAPAATSVGDLPAPGEAAKTVDFTEPAPPKSLGMLSRARHTEDGDGGKKEAA